MPAFRNLRSRPVPALHATPALIRELSTEPSTPTSPTLHTRAYQRALGRQRKTGSVRAVLHYVQTGNDLQPWLWPVHDSGERVTPDNLLEHRQTHQFRTPSCLCASLGLDGISYTESAIFLAKSGPATGQYVAACATGQCRYWVYLERLYHQVGLPIGRYPRRVDRDRVAPAPDTPKSHSSAARRLQGLEKQLGPLIDLVVETPGQLDSLSNEQIARPWSSATTAGIASFSPDSESECCFSLLLQLDEIRQPGLSEEQFRDLFWKCRKCKMYMTRRATVFHQCNQATGTAIPEVIDLTNED